MPRALLLAVLVFVLMTALGQDARANGAAATGTWQEAHQTNGDVRVTVSSDGIALFRHRIRLRIVAGRFKFVDVLGLDPRGELASDVHVLPEKGVEIAARAEPSPKVTGATRVTFDEPKGLTRGIYALDLTYRLDLVAANVLARDGALLRLAWTSPAAPEGVDGARVVFDLPAAPTPPRLASAEDAPTTLVTVDRGTDRDEVELLRARVPRGEAVTWAIRVDPKAFAAARSEMLAPPSAVPLASDDPERAGTIRASIALGSVAMLVLVLASTKRRSLVARGARLVSLLPLRGGLVAPLHAAAAAAGVACVATARPYAAGVLLLAGVLLATYRAAPRKVGPRGPGRWTEMADAEVLVAPRPLDVDPFDVGTRAGKLALILLASVACAGAVLLAGRAPFVHVAVPLAALTLVPLFVTGTRAQEPKSPVALAAGGLLPARDALARIVDLAHIDLAAIARVREGAKDVDEVRLACAPSVRIPGLRGIELALATASGDALVAPPPTPEVLVRFEDGSAAGAKVASLARGMPVVIGRGPDEKVLRVAPRVPTPEGAARLVARLLSELEGRRTSDVVAAAAGSSEPQAAPPSTVRKSRRWRGPERRTAGRPAARRDLAGGARTAPGPCYSAG